LKKSPLKRGNSKLKRTPLKQGTPVTKRRKRIKPVSDKRKEVNVERRLFNLRLPAKCDICSPVCWGKAESWHEAIKRSAGGEITPSLKALEQGQKFFAACNVCNSFLEQHPAWGRERGFVISGHKPVREQQNRS